MPSEHCKDKKALHLDKSGAFKIDKNQNLVWEDSTYGRIVFTAKQVEAIKFLINSVITGMVNDA